MSNLKFAIIKFIGKPGQKEGQIVLELDQEEFLNKLRSRVGELLAVAESSFSKKHTREKVDISIELAFMSILKEFKNETIRIF